LKLASQVVVVNRSAERGNVLAGVRLTSQVQATRQERVTVEECNIEGVHVLSDLLLGGAVALTRLSVRKTDTLSNTNRKSKQ
jgi:hypothetical protein